MPDVRRYRDLRAEGLTNHRVIRLPEEGWQRPYRGIYVPPGADGRIAAAYESVGAPVVLSHLTAARLHGFEGIDGLPGFWQPRISVVELTAPRGRGIRQRKGARVYRSDIDDGEIVEFGPWSVTSALRTLIDLCISLTTLPAVVMLDSALNLGHIDLHDVSRMHEVIRRRRHATHARKALRLCRIGAQSPFESVSRVTFGELGLVPLELQHVVLDEQGRFVARADMGFGEDRVTVLGEADGRNAHEGMRAHDYQRESRLRRMGFEVVRWDWSQLVNDPSGIVRDIRAFMQLPSRRG